MSGRERDCSNGRTGSDLGHELLPREYPPRRPSADDKDDAAVQNRSMPILECPQCRVRQYAHVSYVVDVCCVECGYRLIAPRAAPVAVGRTPGDMRRGQRRGGAGPYAGGMRRPR
jgi:ribosomal protein S27E